MLLPFALLVASPAVGRAQSCPAETAALPPALQGWRAASSAPAIGRAFEVRGADPATVRGLIPDAVARGGFAALVPFEVKADATYDIALSDSAWIDVVAGDRTIAASGHQRGPACSGISKIVDFRLRPGRYALHISAMKTPNLRVMIVRA